MAETDSLKAPPATRRQLLLALGAAGATAAMGTLLWPFGRGALPTPDRRLSARRTGFALGAQMSILELHENRTTAEEAVQAAFAELETVESVMSLHRPESQPGSLNQTCLDGRCVATSGDDDTTFTPGRVQHHILDKRTGRSPTEFQSVTVPARSGLEADAPSTAVFVAGIERGIRLIEASPGAEGCSC